MQTLKCPRCGEHRQTEAEPLSIVECVCGCNLRVPRTPQAAPPVDADLERAARVQASVLVSELEKIEAELIERAGAEAVDEFKALAGERFGEFVETVLEDAPEPIARVLREIVGERFPLVSEVVEDDLESGDFQADTASDPDADPPPVG